MIAYGPKWKIVRGRFKKEGSFSGGAIQGFTALVNGHGDAVGWYDCDEDPGEDEKKDKCVLRELVELDQKFATSGSKTNRAREAESCFGQMKEKHRKIYKNIKAELCNMVGSNYKQTKVKDENTPKLEQNMVLGH